MKTCSQCHTEKLFSEFNIDSSGKYTDGFRPQCKKCHNDGRLNSHLKKRNDFVIKFGGKCTKCNNDDIETLGFRNSASKRFNSLTSSSSAGIKMKEIEENKDINILLCVNCHVKMKNQ